ncbi:MAG: hypothetical protein ABIJ30_03410 [bacterium]
MFVSTLNSALTNWMNIFTIIGVIAALVVYAQNSLAQRRQRSIENALRYLDYHSRIFAPGSYCRANIKAMEKDTYKRDINDCKMELKFNEFLSSCEYMALLHKAGGAPKSINAYMMGWFAKQIYPQLTDREKAEPYWELAIDFLHETKLEAEKLDSMPKDQRIKYLRKNSFY